MKKIIFIICLFTQQFSYGEDWTYLWSNKNGYVSVKPITSSKVIREYWYKFSWNTDGYTDEINQINCDTKMIRRLLGIYFNKDGTYMNSTNFMEQDKNFYSFKDDLDFKIHEFICK